PLEGDKRREGLPACVRLDRYRYPAVVPGAGIDVLRRAGERLIAPADVLLAGELLMHERGREEVQCRLELRQVDVRAVPGSAAVVEHGHQRGAGHPRREAVGVRLAGPDRLAVGPAGEVAQAEQA